MLSLTLQLYRIFRQGCLLAATRMFNMLEDEPDKPPKKPRSTSHMTFQDRSDSYDIDTPLLGSLVVVKNRHNMDGTSNAEVMDVVQVDNVSSDRTLAPTIQPHSSYTRRHGSDSQIGVGRPQCPCRVWCVCLHLVLTQADRQMPPSLCGRMALRN